MPKVVTTVNLDFDEKEEFLRRFGKDALSDFLRRAIHQKLESEKNEKPIPDFSAVGTASRRYNDMGVNEDLRKYLPKIVDTDDLQELRELNLTGQEITRITGKMIGEKLGTQQIKKETVLPFTYERKFNLKQQ